MTSKLETILKGSTGTIPWLVLDKLSSCGVYERKGKLSMNYFPAKKQSKRKKKFQVPTKVKRGTLIYYQELMFKNIL